MIQNKLKNSIEEFMILISEGKIDIYNEFSFQHELGIYLREKLKDDKYLIQFERNVSFFNIDKKDTIKKEMDIVVFSDDKREKYCIELKYPSNGQYPESMYSFIKDIKFCEQLVQKGFTGAVSIVLVEDKLFHSGELKDGIYDYFRNKGQITGEVNKPTGYKTDSILIKGKYNVEWKEIKGDSKYYSIWIEKNSNIIGDLCKEEINNKVEKLEDQVIVNTKDKSKVNLGVYDVCKYIRETIEEAKKDGRESVTLISGNIHREVGLKNAMPTVCNAMRKVMEEYPNSILKKPDTVKKDNSSTISVEYKFI